MTNRELYRYHVEAGQLKGSLVGFLLKDHIKAFYKRDSQRILSLTEKIAELQKEYLVFEDGKIKVDEQGHSVVKEGKTKEELDKAYNELLNQDFLQFAY